MVNVNNFENASQLRELMDKPRADFSHLFSELKMSEMQTLSSSYQNTSKDYLPGLQFTPDRGDAAAARRQTLEDRSAAFAPSTAQRIPFISEITPEFMKSVKEQLNSMVQMFAGDSKAPQERAAEKPQFGDYGSKGQAREAILSTTIRPSVNNGYREINTLKGTNDVVSTVDVYLDPKTQSITRLTRMADGKMFSIETENKDKSREVITFDENEKKMSTQLLLPNGGYEWRDANDKVVFSNIRQKDAEVSAKTRK